MINMVVDTSAGEIAIGLFDGKKLLAEKHLKAEQKYNKILADAISGILKETKLNFSNIDVFAASAGPGSFTGIRVGMATMKGFAQALSKKFYSVSTLDIMAWAAIKRGTKGIVFPIMDARRGELYTAEYEIKGEMAKRVSDYIMTTEQVLEKKIPKRAAVCIMENEADLFKLFSKNETIAVVKLKENDMSVFNEIVLYNSADLKNENIYNMEPLYIRKSEAEVTLINKTINARKGK